MGIPIGMLRPGGLYQVHYKLKTYYQSSGAANISLADGMGGILGPATILPRSGAGRKARPLDQPGSCPLPPANMPASVCSAPTTMAAMSRTSALLAASLVPGETETITDEVTGETSTATYRYDGPATNDAEHSAAVKQFQQ